MRVIPLLVVASVVIGTESKDFSSRRNAEHIDTDVVSSGRAKRLVMKDFTNINSTWKDGVFYMFNTSDQTVQKAFKMGVKVWTELTCVDFKEDKNAKDKVVVVDDDESSSAIGRIGGDQLLSLGDDPTEGTAVHEIGHTLGLIHTMSRFDRDSYIKILMENVNPFLRKEFDKISRAYTDTYGMGYDYGSVMHYGELSCSVNNKTTVIALNPRYQKTMGSEMIAFSEVFMINEHYGCNEKCKKSTSAKCENEGFPHPRNCSICICPRGYGGDLCDRRPPGCGADLRTTSEKQTINGRLGHGVDLRDQFEFCYYMIQAPNGKKVEIDVKSMSSGYYEAGCPRGGIEIKAQEDQKLTGYRYCSVNGTEGPIVSSFGRLPVIMFNRQGALNVTFTYRHV